MKKILIGCLCVLLLSGCAKDDKKPNPSPTPTPSQDAQTTMKLSEMLPESVKEISLRIETNIETITIEFKEAEVNDVLNALKEMSVSEDFTAHAGSGATTYRIMYTDANDTQHEITEQGNVIRVADGTKVGPTTTDGLIDAYVMAMDWVISLSDFEMLAPVHVETDDYIVTCEKGDTSTYDLNYLRDIEFDPFALGFTVITDEGKALTEMPTEGDYLLILTKDNATYQLKVTSSVK